MPTTGKIIFENNPMKVFYTGRLLRGTFHLNLTERKTVRGIYIRIYGAVKVRWTTGTDDDKRTHRADVDYLDEKTYFIGGFNDAIRLLPGLYSYNFQCMLPVELPTSFESTYGHIRYMAQVVLDIPNRINKKFEEPFTVIRAVDLNVDPTLRTPVVVSKMKNRLFTSGEIRIVASTPVGGYTPGQTINLALEVNNGSTESISKFSVKLIEQIAYHTTSLRSSTSEQIPISKQYVNGCEKRNIKTIRVNIPVPSVPPTDSRSNSIIKIEYIVRIKGSVGILKDFELFLPIIIGSYPIRDVTPAVVYTQARPSAPANLPTNDAAEFHRRYKIDQPSTPANLTTNNAASTYPDEDPPTYEDAVHGGGTNSSEFMPKYRVFKRATSYSSES